jgi:hypothetical protein
VYTSTSLHVGFAISQDRSLAFPGLGNEVNKRRG